jgi:hypothetical protein
VPDTSVLTVLSPVFLMVLGLLVLSGYGGQDPVRDLLHGAVLAVLVAWLPHLFLPSGTTQRGARSRSRSEHRTWLGVLAAVLVLGLGLGVGLWWRVPRPALILAVTMWIAVLAAAVISRWWPICRHTAVAGTVSAALTVQIWPPGALALLLPVLVGVASARTGRRRTAGVAAAVGLGLILGALPMLLWG